MSKKTNNNPIPTGTKTLRDVLPETEKQTPPQKVVLKKQQIQKEEPLKNELSSLYEDLKKLRVQELDSDDENEREALMERLEKTVEATLEKTYKAAKAPINSHRDWDTQDETLKQKDKELRELQAQIEGYKKKTRGIKNRRIATMKNMEKMTDVTNELRDSERIMRELEDNLRVLQKNNKYQEKALNKLADDTGYEAKVSTLNDELRNLKEQYKQMEKDHKAEESVQLEHHKKFVAAEEENVRLKRIMIALKNNKDPFDGINDIEEVIEGGKKEVLAYEQAEKSEEKRHLLKMKKLAEEKAQLNKEIEDLENQIAACEQENIDKADKIKTRQKMIKDNQEKMIEAERKRLADIEAEAKKQRDIEEGKIKAELKAKNKKDKPRKVDRDDEDDRSLNGKGKNSPRDDHSEKDSNFYNDRLLSDRDDLSEKEDKKVKKLKGDIVDEKDQKNESKAAKSIKDPVGISDQKNETKGKAEKPKVDAPTSPKITDKKAPKQPEKPAPRQEVKPVEKPIEKSKK